MQNTAKGLVLIGLLCAAGLSWGQGGGRRAGAAQQGTPAAAPAETQGRGGRGGGGEGAAASRFYNYDTTASIGAPIAEGPPAETHQKISVNGESLAYTARAGFLPLRNATS